MWIVVPIWHRRGELDTKYTSSPCRALTGTIATLFSSHLVNLARSVCSVWKQWYKEGLNNNSVFQFYRLTSCWQEIKTHIFLLRLHNPTCMRQYTEGAAESILCKHFFHLQRRETPAQQKPGFTGASRKTVCNRLVTAGEGRFCTCRWKLKHTRDTVYHSTEVLKGNSSFTALYNRPNQVYALEVGSDASAWMLVVSQPSPIPALCPHFPWWTTPSPPKQVQLTQSCDKATDTRHALNHS